MEEIDIKKKERCLKEKKNKGMHDFCFLHIQLFNNFGKIAFTRKRKDW